MGTAVITGASAGIGATFAGKLAAQGYDLILVARRKDMLESFGARLTGEFEVRVDTITADLASDTGIAVVEERIKSINNLTLLINNAGFGTIGMFAESDFQKQLDMNRVHITATFRLCRAVLPNMIANRQGAIVNVSSISAFLTGPGSVTYSATKAYLNSFSASLDAEVREHGLQVQALCPGFTRTEFHEVGDFEGFDRSEIPDWLWLSADRVVDESLRGLKKRQVVVIPGFRYRLIVRLLRNPLLKGMVHRKVERKRQRN